jgi:mono/diheme cytochrome c family protein
MKCRAYRLHLLVAVSFLGAFAVGAAQAQTMQSATMTSAGGSLATGRMLYAADCAVGHLASGAGGVHFGAAVSADLQSPGLEQTYRGDDKLIMRAILEAKDQDGAPLDHPMPAWAGRLSPAEAADIVAYLHTLHD